MPRGVRLSEAKVRLITKRYARGDAVEDIAAKAGITPNAVYIRCRGQPRPTTQQRGENNASAFLADAAVKEIRRRVAGGERQADVAKHFGVSKTCVCEIARGDRWGHVGGPIRTQRYKLTDADVADIRRRALAGEAGVSLAREYGIHKAAVSRIKNRKGPYALRG